MAAAFRRARFRFTSTHDGTPNTLLEAMACGCTPVAGISIDSVDRRRREQAWPIRERTASPRRSSWGPTCSRAAANRRLISRAVCPRHEPAEAFYRQRVGGYLRGIRDLERCPR
jgi:hypothetical protein